MTASGDRIWGFPAWMVGLALAAFVVALTVTFIVMSYSQFSAIQEDARHLIIGKTAASEIGAISAMANGPETARLRVLAELEWQGMVMRSDRTAVALQARTWLRFLLSLYGMILVAIGSVFVLGYVTSSKFVARAEAGDYKFALATTSPGLILAVAGCVLMVVAAVFQHRISTDEGAAFMLLERGPGPQSATVGREVPAPN